MKSKYNQVLALLLAVMMVISLLPMAALAADGEMAVAEPTEETAETTEETTEETEEVAIAEPEDGVIEAVTATVVTGSALNVTGNTAMLSMTCTKSEGRLWIGFDVIIAGGQRVMYAPYTSFDDALDNQTINLPVEGLVPGVTYQFRAATSDNLCGEWVSFTTPADASILEMTLGQSYDAAYNGYKLTPETSGTYRFAMDGAGYIEIHAADGTDVDAAYSNEGATAVELSVSLAAGETYYIWSVSEKDNAKISASLAPTGDTTEVKASTDSVSTAADGTVKAYGYFTVPDSSYDIGFSLGTAEDGSYYGSTSWEAEGKMANERFGTALDWNPLVPGVTYYYRAYVSNRNVMGDITLGEAKSFVAPQRSYDTLTVGGSKTLSSWEHKSYAFTPTESASYKLSILGGSVIVFDSMGVRIGNEDDALTFAATAGKTYYIGASNGYTEGTRQLTLTKTGGISADGVVAVGTACSISVNKTYALTIGTAGWYSFTSGSADKLTEMTVRDSSGSITLDYNVGTAGSRLTDQVQLAAGVYTIEVSACADNAKLTVAPFVANESLAFAAATNGALKVSATGATLSGAFTAPKIDTGAYLMGFEYRVKGTTDTSVVWADAGVQQIEGEEHRKALTNLTAGKTYEYRAFIDPSYGEQMVENGYYSIGSAAVYGQWVMLTAQTESSAAGFAAVTGDPVVSGGKVTLSGTFTMPASDAQNAYWYGVEYGTEPYVMLDGNNGQFGSAALAGQKKSYEVDTQAQLLVPGATYYCWALIRSGDMSMTRYSRGEVKTFTAPNSTFETLTTGAAKTAPAYTSNHYCFTAGETGSYSLSLDCSAAGDLYLTVYNAKGELIAQELDLGSVSFSATAGEKYYIDAYVGASEAGRLTIAKAATQTITLGQKVSGVGPFEIELNQGMYFIEADNDCLVDVYQGPDLWDTQSINSLFEAGVSAVYRFVPSKGVTNFRIVSLMDATLPTIAAGETKTFTSKDAETYFRFTAAQTGKYMIRIGSGGGVYYQADTEYGFYCEDGSVVELNAKDSIVIRLYDIQEREPDETWSGELSIIDLASAKIDTIALGQTVTSSGSSILSFTPESAGFYVVETANGSARATSAEGYYVTNQVENGKTLFLVQSAIEYYLVIRQTAAGGSVKIRKAVDSDFRTMTAGVSYNTVGFYRFTPQEASNYELIASHGEASAYLSNGRDLASAYGTEEEAAKGYLYLLSGQSAYVYVASESTVIRKYTPAALKMGTSVALTGEIVRYRFTAETAGTYVIQAMGSEVIGGDIHVSDSMGRSMAYGNLYMILNLEAGQTIYVDLSSEDGAGTAVIDKQENRIAGDLTSGETKTTTDFEQLWRFVPQKSGLYVVSVSEWTWVYELDDSVSYEMATAHSVLFLQLQEGKSYYFMALNSGVTIKPESADQFGIMPIEQGKSVTTSGTAIYRFTAPEAGLYTIQSTDCETYLCAKDAIDFCGDVMAASLAKGEQVYLCAWSSTAGNSLSIDRIDVETAGTKLGVDTYTVDKTGNYVFQAPADGTYVVSAREWMYALVTWEDGARRSEYASGDTLSLGTLKAGSCAFIQTYLERRDKSGTLTITKLADWPQKTASLGENTKLDTTALYRFTAPEAGEYTFGVTMPPEEYAYGRVYDQTMTSWDIYIDADEQTTTTVSMLAGDSVYISVGRGTAATVLTIEKTGAGPESVADALDALVTDSTKTNAEKREEIQSMDTEALMETLAASEDAVEDLKALEKAVGSAGSVSIVVEASAQDVVAKDNVTIIGATLNELAQNGADVKLTISATAKKELPSVVDPNKAVFLQFDLEGVKNSQELSVPVCITMEVPENIHWELVRLVHHTGSSYEILYPTSYVENGVRYARFVIGGFSPFTLAEQIHVPGDVDGNGSKNIMDVLALLKSVAGISSTIVYGDVDGNGSKNIMDVLALLKSVAGISSTIY